jgi:hypothetical protein
VYTICSSCDWTGRDETPVKVAADQSSATPSGWRRWLPWAGRLVVLGLVVFWLVRYADLPALGLALARISLFAFVPAMGFSLLIILIGGIRWTVMMRAFGAREIPPLATLVSLFFVGLFYNTYVPGAVGGDVVRGVVTRRCFDESAGSYVVVGLERLIGLSGMGLLFVLGLIIGPRVFTWGQLWPWLTAVALLVTVVAILVAASGRLSKHLRQLPALRSPLLLFWAFVLSLASHFCGITVVYSLSVGMGLSLTYAAMVLVVPVALTTAFIPLSLGGFGPREVTMVALFRLLEVETEQGVALSLAYAAVNLIVAGIGGVIQLVRGRLRKT